MGTSLSGLKPKDTYFGLIKTTDNGTISATPKYLSDGSGNDSVVALGTESVGIGTNSPLGILHLFKSAATTRMLLDGDAGQSKIITYRTGGFQRFGLYVNNTAESGSNVGSDFQIRAYSDAGTLLSTPLFIKRSTGNIGMGTTSPTAKLHILGTGATSATSSLLVQNSAGTELLKVQDDGKILGNSLYRNDAANLTYIELENTTTVNNGILFNVRNASSNTFKFKGQNSYYFTLSYGSRSGAAWFGDSTSLVTTNASAQVQIDSTTKGFLPPRMTTIQRDAIASPAAGLIVYDSTNNSVAYRDAANWGYLSGATQSILGIGGTVNIPFSSGNIVQLSLTASTILTFSNAVVGTYILEVLQGGTGSYTLTYPANVKWSNGVAPTLTTTVGKTDIITLFYDGTNFFGTYSLNY